MVRLTHPHLLAAARWARWAVGLLLVAVVLGHFDLGAVAAAIGHADAPLAIAAIAALVAMQVVGAAAWHALSRRLGGALSWAAALRAYYIAQAIGNLTPANIGGDAYRIHATRENGWARSLTPILVQRVTSVTALGVLALVGLAALPPWPAQTLVVGAVIVASVGASGAALLIARRTARVVGGDRGGQATPSRLIAAWGVGTGFGLCLHAGSIACMFAIAVAVDPSSLQPGALASLAVARLAILVPLSPAGLGIGEGALSLLFPRIGLPAEVALATALLGRVALVATSLIGAVLWGRTHSGTPAREQEPEPGERSVA